MKKILTFIIICMMIFTSVSCSAPKSGSKKENPSSDSRKENAKNEQSPARQAVISTKESPAQPGEWTATKRYSSITQNLHTVYLRVTDIISDASFVNPVLESYNNEGHVSSFPTPDRPDLEYRLLKYEVMFPSDFPETKKGIPFTDMKFFLRATDGSDYITAEEPAIALPYVYDISESTAPIFAGETFTDGLAVFLIEKDTPGYLLENNYYINKDCFSCYFQGQ